MATAPAASAADRTATFAPTGEPQSFVVPPGVTELGVTATGASGGVGRSRKTAGRGATVRGRLTGLAPGQTLTVVVGTAGTLAGGPGFNGGGGAQYGGGGGASDVRWCAPDADGCDTLGSRLVVAAGGGGTGGGGGATNSGGDAGSAGTGVSGPCDGSAAGGGAASPTAGGTGGGIVAAPAGAAGTAGSLGLGGHGGIASAFGNAVGGGGGGGVYGGGGGGTTGACGAGGGGGSNLVPADGTAVVEASATPTVQLAYAAGAATSFGALTLSRTAIVANGRERTQASVTVLDDAGRALPGETVMFSADVSGVAVGPTTDHGDGTYTADIVATEPQTARIAVSSSAFDAPKSTDLLVRAVPTAEVTAPTSGLGGLRTLQGSPSLARVAGTAEAGIDAVTIGCRAPDGTFETGRDDVPVVDGRFEATAVDTGLFAAACRLIAVNAAVDRRPANLEGARGPGLRFPKFVAPRAADGVEWYEVRWPGTVASSTVQDPDRCALESPVADGTRIGGFTCPNGWQEPRVVTIDGAPAYGAGTFGYNGSTFDGLTVPRFTVTATPQEDGSIVVTDRSAMVGCEDGRRLFTSPRCPALRDSGVERTSETRIEADGLTVRRVVTYRAVDGREHRIEVQADGFPASAATAWRLPGSADYGAFAGGDAVDLAPGVAAVAGRTDGGYAAVVHRPAPGRVRAHGGGGYDASWTERTVRPGAPASYGTILASRPEGADLDRFVQTQLPGRRPALDVAEPDQVDGPVARVTGTAVGDEGVTVDVSGTPAAVGDDGRFAVEVPVPVGRTRLIVRATDGFGLGVEREVVVTRLAPVVTPEPVAPVGGGTASPLDPPAPSPGAPSPAPALPPTGPAKAPVTPRPRIERTAAPKVTGRRTLTLRTGLTAACPARAAPCTATVVARVVGVRGAAGAAGRSAVTLGTGARRALVLRPSTRTSRLLRTGRTVRLRVTATVRDRAGNVATLSRTVRVRLGR